MARTRGNRGANADCGKQENIIFAKNLTGYLNEAGIQSAEFAKMCGVCPSTMSDYLNANKSPKLSTAIKIACSLGASLDDLCGIENGEKMGMPGFRSIVLMPKPSTKYVIKPLGDGTFELHELGGRNA